MKRSATLPAAHGDAKLGRRLPMSIKSLLHVLLVLAIAGVLASTAAAQRGGGKKSKGGGKGGDKGGQSSIVNTLLPKPAPPIQADPFEDFPKLKGSAPSLGPGAKARTTLLPAPVDETEQLPEIPVFEGDTSTFAWRDPRDPELQRYYFDVCDHDGTEWISFREAEVSLEITREAFALYDKDRDGRIRREEFGERYAAIVDRSGSYVPPRPAVAKPPTVGRDEPSTDAEGMKLMETFDENGDLTLDPAEIDELITRTGLPRAEVDVERVLSVTDFDGTRAIEVGELETLKVSLLAAAQLFGLDLDIGGAKTTSKSATPGVIPPVRRITTPTAHFARLDQDGDGFLSDGDLTILQSPMHLSVRTSAVLAALDRDGDGRLSPAEFKGAFR